jgi:hypothetical protein
VTRIDGVVVVADDSKAEIRAQGGIEPIVRCLSAADPMTVKYAMRAVSILSVQGALRSSLSCVLSPYARGRLQPTTGR